jgi:FkbH-like protein
MLEIVVAATFTAEPLEKPLQFLLGELNTPAQIHFAPYSQIFQQLLDSASMMAQNLNGLNVLLISLEDWTGLQQASFQESHKNLRRSASDLIEALEAAAGRSPAPTLVCFCPPAPEWLALPGAPQGPSRLEMLNQFEAETAALLEKISGVYAVTSKTILDTYPVKKYDDSYRNQVGHIPYNEDFFTALAAMIARKLYAIRRRPYKVIVLDCDNTLWQGVVGEDGPQGVKITAPLRALQAFFLEQSKAGMVLCLNSKNIEEDVLRVFDENPDMVLKRQHLVTWRINWLPKSANLIALADELNLGLGSFIFVDDNPLECAEVQTACPQVLTVQIPAEPEKIPAFLAHHWAFDQLKITTEDQKRTLLYQQNMQRERLRQSSITYADFVASLDLQISIQPLENAQLARAAQLSQRTSQFNATNVRRTESEIQCLLQCSQAQVRVVKVKDRFGDYGLVGLLVFEIIPEGLMVDSFLLSCRTLGRGVEHRMLAELGHIALENDLSMIEFPYIPTERNQPILNFLEQTGNQFKTRIGDSWLYKFPAAFATGLAFHPGETQPELPEESPADIKPPQAPGSTKTIATSTSLLLSRIAAEFQDAQHIASLVASQDKRSRSAFEQPYTPPANPQEGQLAALWAEVLELDRVGRQDHFFELGGNSLRAALLVGRLHDVFHVSLPIQSIFDTPTVAEMSQYLDVIQWSGQKSLSVRDGAASEAANSYLTISGADLLYQEGLPLEEGEI